VDTLTHIAFGAVVGEVLAGKRIGKKALLLGAAAQSLPDIDFIAALWLSPADNLLAHRGFTHSFLFLLLITPALALLARRWRFTNQMPLRSWIYFFGIQILIHLLIDSLNAYGVGWLEPFHHFRFSFHVLFVADPFFSIPLALACLALLMLRSDHPKRFLWTRIGLTVAMVYMMYAFCNKLIIERDIRKAYANTNIISEHYFSTPTPFNSWLRYSIAEVDSGYYASYHSVFDIHTVSELTFFPRNEALIKPLNDSEELRSLLRFSQDYYTIEKWEDTLVFNDLRFGQMAGWADPNAKFAFHYYLQHPKENKFVVQRGRFGNWNAETRRLLLERIRGN
jgi:inner membrane protein